LKRKAGQRADSEKSDRSLSQKRKQDVKKGKPRAKDIHMSANDDDEGSKRGRSRSKSPAGKKNGSKKRDESIPEEDMEVDDEEVKNKFEDKSIHNLKIGEIKELLSERGLPNKGKKDFLITVLGEHLGML
jgi:hypothetical protein